MQDITPTELSAWLENTAQPDPILLDVREQWEFDICHITGARLVPMDSIPDQYAQFGGDEPVVCICHHGVRSMQVGAFLEKRGFSRVHNLRGGVDAWATEIDSTMPTY